MYLYSLGMLYILPICMHVYMYDYRRDREFGRGHGEAQKS